MEWAVWKPIYHKILQDFGFRAEADVASAEILADLIIEKNIPSYRTIVERFGEQVTICAAAESLEGALDTMTDSRTIISAGSATSRLMRNGIIPDIIVTDLDGEVEYDIRASDEGSLMFVHAHGDNIAIIERTLPMLNGPIVPTVQCQPFGLVYNFGGFTDGDRSYLTAKHFEVKDVRFVGWDFKKAFPKKGVDLNIKKKKLMWAEWIIDNY
ncbi:MAG: DUF115 domain-containing protein [Methanomassiliicoccales archaeon]|nr:DUF115 domain-containing protein [Methanomassiliicoccales archaeon]